VQVSLDTHIYLTGRSRVQSEVERKLEGTASFVLIEPMGDGIVRYLRKKLTNDTFLEMMSSTLEANIIELIPEVSSEKYVELPRKIKNQ